MSEAKIKGRCFCGSVEFSLVPPTDFVGHCHCESCRLSHGAPFVTWTSVPKDRFKLLRGEEVLHWYGSSEWIEWGFCSKCGSSMLYRVIKEGHPESPKTDRMYVSVGSLVDPLDSRPTAHFSYEEKYSWLAMEDGLPKFRRKTSELIE
jgi:hypothetical protein